MKLIRLVTGLSVFSWLSLQAETVMLHPVADTSLFQTSPNNNLGAVTGLPAGTTLAGEKSRMLMKFAPATAMPSNAVVTSAKLTLFLVKAPSSAVNSKFDLRRVLVNWGEGANATENNGGLAKTGESSWNARLAPSTLWSTPGGAIGLDYSNQVSASLQVNGVGTYNFISNSNLVQDVQDWLQKPGSNQGWVLMTESESISSTARRFGSRESANSAPALLVTYNVPQPPVAPQLQVLAITKDAFVFGFDPATNQVYVVEFKNGLDQIVWQTLTNISASAAPQPVMISDSISSSPHRCYRTRTP